MQLPPTEVVKDKVIVLGQSAFFLTYELISQHRVCNSAMHTQLSAKPVVATALQQLKQRCMDFL